jgi:hypothetical protein
MRGRVAAVADHRERKKAKSNSNGQRQPQETQEQLPQQQGGPQEGSARALPATERQHARRPQTTAGSWHGTQKDLLRTSRNRRIAVQKQQRQQQRYFHRDRQDDQDSGFVRLRFRRSAGSAPGQGCSVCRRCRGCLRGGCRGDCKETSDGPEAGDTPFPGGPVLLPQQIRAASSDRTLLSGLRLRACRLCLSRLLSHHFHYPLSALTMLLLTLLYLMASLLVLLEFARQSLL